MVHAFNFSAWEAEAGRVLWVKGHRGVQELVPEQLGRIYRETLSQIPQKKDKYTYIEVYKRIFHWINFNKMITMMLKYAGDWIITMSNNIFENFHFITGH